MRASPGYNMMVAPSGLVPLGPGGAFFCANLYARPCTKRGFSVCLLVLCYALLRAVAELYKYGSIAAFGVLYAIVCLLMRLAVNVTIVHCKSLI